MTLNSTTETLIVTTASGADIDYLVEYVDLTTEAWGDHQKGKITTATNTTICAAPGADVQRVISSVSLVNIEAGADNEVIVFVDDSGTAYRVYKGEILRDEKLEYLKGEGWKRYNADGKLIFVGDTGLTGASGSGSSTTWVAYSDADHTAVDGEGYNIQSSNISGTHSEDVSGIADYCEFMNGQDDPSKVVNLIGETVYASGGLEIITAVPTLGHTTLKRIGGILILY